MLHRVSRVLIALALVAVAGCAGRRGEPEACAVACDHVIELALGKAEAGEAGRASAAQKAACLKTCRAGEIDARCVIASRTVEQAMTCRRPAAGAVSE